MNFFHYTGFFFLILQILALISLKLNAKKAISSRATSVVESEMYYDRVHVLSGATNVLMYLVLASVALSIILPAIR